MVTYIMWRPELETYRRHTLRDEALLHDVLELGDDRIKVGPLCRILVPAALEERRETREHLGRNRRTESLEHAVLQVREALGSKLVELHASGNLPERDAEREHVRLGRRDVARERLWSTIERRSARGIANNQVSTTTQGCTRA